MRIGLVIFDDFTDLDFFLPWDLLNRPRTMGITSDWKVEIIGDKPSHTSKAGLPVAVTCAPEQASECDAVLFVSGPATRQLCRDQSWLGRFRLDPAKQIIAAMDSGALLLAAMGHLKGKSATTYPTAQAALQEMGVEVKIQSLVIEGNVATAAACLAAAELSEWILGRLLGTQGAEKVLTSVTPLSKQGPTESRDEASRLSLFKI